MRPAERLAAELRNNLKRRKAQARGRAALTDADGPGAQPPDKRPVGRGDGES